MAGTNTDRNLLIGVLALQMDFIGRDQLVSAVQAWITDKSRPLDQILVAQGALAEDAQPLLVGLVDKHIEMHAGDPEKSLAAVSSLGSVRDELEQLEDPDLEASLVHATHPPDQTRNDPFATMISTATGEFTSQGRRFRILRPHAVGGLGKISVAHDSELAREVALKEMKETIADDPTSRSRFVIEAEITGGLEHPGIVPVYGFGQYADGRPYYAMRFIRGDSLKEAIADFHDEKENRDATETSLQLHKLLGRFVDVCNAIEYAHSRGVLHRDLKPGNIMLGKYGETLVVDWGLAKTTADDQTVPNVDEVPLRPSSHSGSTATVMGTHLGTPGYMSPEQAAGRLDLLGPASDVYSLGATMYALLTGRPPYKGGRIEEMLREIQRGNFPKPTSVVSDIPKALEAICLKAMAVRPPDRYNSAAALAADVEKWMADEPVSAWTEPLLVRIGRWSRRHRTLVAGILAATSVAIVILTVFAIVVGQKNSEIRAEYARAEGNLEVARQAIDTMLTEVGESELEDIPQFEQPRRRLLERARAFYQKIAEQNDDQVDLQADIAVAWRRVADIDRLLKSKDDSERGYIESIERLSRIVERSPDNADYKSSLGYAYNQLAWFYLDYDLDRAIEACGKGITIWQELGDSASPPPSYRRELARSHYNRGIAYNESGRQPEAKADYDQAIALLTRLVDSRESGVNVVECRRDLSRCYNNLGFVNELLGDTSSAQENYERATQLGEQIRTAEPTKREYAKELAIYYNRQSNLLGSLDRLDDADRSIQLSLALWSELVKPLPKLANELANAHIAQAVIQRRRGQLDDAELAFRVAESSFRDLAERFPGDPQYRDRHGYALYGQGQVCFMRGDYTNAMRFVAEALAEHLLALQAKPGEPQYQNHLRNDYQVLEYTFDKLGLEADKLEVLAFKDGGASQESELYYAAILLSKCLAGISDNQALAGENRDKLKARLASTAVSLLERAVAADARLRDELLEDAAGGELQDLNESPLFQNFLRQIERDSSPQNAASESENPKEK